VTIENDDRKVVKFDFSRVVQSLAFALRACLESFAQHLNDASASIFRLKTLQSIDMQFLCLRLFADDGIAEKLGNVEFRRTPVGVD
jgi:hypothetical protein